MTDNAKIRKELLTELKCITKKMSELQYQMTAYEDIGEYEKADDCFEDLKMLNEQERMLTRSIEKACGILASVQADIQHIWAREVLQRLKNGSC